MSLLLPRVAARVFNTPLAVTPEKAVAMLIGLGARMVDGGVVLSGDVRPADHDTRREPQAGVIGDPLGRDLDQRGRRPYATHESVAVIPLEGSLVHKGAYVGKSSGETSFQGLQAQIVRAHRDPMVKGVVFEHDSHGGEVNGMFETARMIARLSADKPTMAILTHVSCSAAYVNAAPCRQIVIPKTGAAGSIGALVLHADLSGKHEKDGVKVTIVASGRHKADGNPLEPLADEVRARLQAQVDTVRDMFAETVGEGRGRRLAKAAALATEAQVYHGADAVAAGLADVVADPHEAFAAFVAAVNRA